MISDSRKDDCKVLLRLWRGSMMCLLQLLPSPRQLHRPLTAPAPKAVWRNYAKNASGGCNLSDWKTVQWSVRDQQRPKLRSNLVFLGFPRCIPVIGRLSRESHPCLYYEKKRQDEDMTKTPEPAWFTWDVRSRRQAFLVPNQTSVYNLWLFSLGNTHFPILPLEQKIWPLGWVTV